VGNLLLQDCRLLIIWLLQAVVPEVMQLVVVVVQGGICLHHLPQRWQLFTAYQ
jgi:prepilin signal peptidase PulO-like enzyme (type II secretory pathway)